MKATGIVRRIDDLGRVVIPKEIRRTLRIREGDSLEIYTDHEGRIILKKYSPVGELEEFAKEYAESLYTDEEFQLRRANYSAHCMPFTKESLFYREIFEKYYHDQSRTIVGFWMPNKAWPNCNVNDPSARVLANYGASGV